VIIPTQIKEALSKGLIAAIAQDATTNEVLMMAWMNEEALLKTLESKRVTYFSRSRNKIWVKGETSGNFQNLVDIKFDCDGDSVLLLINQIGAACHTGQKSCFHNELS
jgi:phosphoribosyl-AMP cyclohydrolase